MATEKIIEKIRKLLRMANDRGASENEIEMALAAAHKLMAQHKVEKWQVESEKPDNFEEEHVYIDTDEWGKPDRMQRYVLHVIAKNFMCVTMISSNPMKEETICTVTGDPAQIEMVLELYHFAIEKYEKRREFRWREHYYNADDPRTRRTFFSGYSMGVPHGIQIALEKSQKGEENEQEFALICRKSIEKVDAWIQKKYPGIQNATPETSVDEEAYQLGYLDGSEFEKKQ